MTFPTAREYIERFYRIRTKEGNLIPFKLNQAQNRFYEVIQKDYGRKPCRYIVLKARQLGMSTFTEALLTFLTMNQPNTDSIIIAHDSTASSNIYGMTKLFVSELPDQLRPPQKYSNAKLLSFDSDDPRQAMKSSIRVGVANDSTRGQTYRYAHLSEVAFWQDAKTAMTAVMQCVPQDNKTIVIIESTANGFNFFYDLWSKAERGENDFTPLFFPWYMDEGYRKAYTGFDLSPYEEEIKEKYNLSLEQLSWRRWAIKNQCNGDEAMFRQEYPISPEEAFVTSGVNVFNTELILSKMKTLKDPLRKGYFSYTYDGQHIKDYRWADDENCLIKIYAEPVPGKQYAIGADTAGDGEDFFASHVLDEDGRQVAVLHFRDDEDRFVRQLYCLGLYYNIALVGIEANFSTYPNKEIQRLEYPMIYVRETYDNILSDYQSKYGFMTTSRTRPMIISQLVEVMRDELHLINDYDTLQEALSFVWLNGKQQASEGTHDDLIMSLAIAYEILKQIKPVPIAQVEHIPTDEEVLFGFGG